MRERNKGGRKANPDGLPRKAYQVYCTSEDAVLVRMFVKLSAEQKAYVKGWIDRGGNIGKKQ